MNENDTLIKGFIAGGVYSRFILTQSRARVGLRSADSTEVKKACFSPVLDDKADELRA